MNARFRRDYIYTIKSGKFQGLALRYLCFDKTNKRYVFVDGHTKRIDEVLISIPRDRISILAQGIKQEHWIGYDSTDNYKRA